MKTFILFIFLSFSTAFAQEHISSLTKLNSTGFNPDTAGQFILITEGNYTCGEFGNNDLLYAIRNDTLLTLDISTMNESVIDLITGISPGQFITGITYSYNSNTMYLGTTSYNTS